ncbi:MAG: riboflavin biosynthesis protein RibF [Candidatus Porifericomitaceae bacterium WSBS_2022_MAG_OTU9]
MKLQRHLLGKAIVGGSAVTVGNFDGLHRGHQHLLDCLRVHAKAERLTRVIVLFEPQPMEFLFPKKAPPRIMGLADKLVFLQQFGIEHVLCMRFNDKLASMHADDFVRTVLVGELATKVLCVGPDFRFGAKREGDAKLLRQAGSQFGFSLAEVPQFMHDNTRVSSTRVRLALAAGNLEQANYLLGHAISVRGRITSGAGRGRTLGVPTLNMEPSHCPPLSGIFASKIHIGGDTYQGASYLGLRPQFADRKSPVLETHLFEQPPSSVNGNWARVELLGKLRPDNIFAGGVPELVRQMKQDIVHAKKWHKEHRP